VGSVNDRVQVWVLLEDVWEVEKICGSSPAFFCGSGYRETIDPVRASADWSGRPGPLLVTTGE